MMVYILTVGEMYVNYPAKSPNKYLQTEQKISIRDNTEPLNLSFGPQAAVSWRSAGGLWPPLL
jgi:hypothetical protein